MKKFLFMGAAAMAVSVSLPASAQTYYTKDRETVTTGSTSYMGTDSTTAASPQQTSRTTTRTERVYELEPAAGKKDPLADFTGPYIGGDIGYSIGSHDTNDPTGPDGDVGLDGVEGGVFAGYGFVHNFSWLGGYAGVELGHEWSGADGNLGGTAYEKDHNWLLTFRPGITMYEDALAYGIVGYSRAEFQSAADEEDLDGLVLGAGSEFNTGTPLKMRMEYTYTNYEDAVLAGNDFEGHDNNIKLGAVFRF